MEVTETPMYIRERGAGGRRERSQKRDLCRWIYFEQIKEELKRIHIVGVGVVKIFFIVVYYESLK